MTIVSEWTRYTGVGFHFWDPEGRLLYRAGSGDARCEYGSCASRIRICTPRGFSEAPIAITFEGHNTYYSAIGTDSIAVRKEKGHSMRLGGLANLKDDAAFKHIVLHEFGHALGLQHEHQNPAIPFKWNDQKVIDYYMKEVNKDLKKEDQWDEAKVRANVLTTLKKDSTKHTAFDRDSVMLYNIPADWTSLGVTMPFNSELSKTDKEFIAKLYPPPS